MGWARGTEVFEQVATTVVAELEEGLTEGAGTRILVALIRALSERGWDTQDESLTEFEGYEFIREAFKATGHGHDFDEWEED
jgi:hypothetical protein